MKVNYDNGLEMKVLEVQNFYKEVAEELAKEDVTTGPREITVSTEEGKSVYKLSLRSGTLMIAELENTFPDSMLEETLKPCFLTCVIPEKNAYKFYKIVPDATGVTVEYGRMGTQKGQLFGARTYHYERSMYWPKYAEKISKGYVDRTDFYMPDATEPLEKAPNEMPARPTTFSAKLFQKLKDLSRKAVRKAKVQVPVTKAIIDKSKELLSEMYKAETVEDFNHNVLELIAILQRPVDTGDGKGVLRMLAKDEKDFARIVQRESDLLQAMEGSITGTISATKADNFSNYDIEVYEATEKQKAQVLAKLSDSLKGKVKTVYRVIPKQQQAAFDAYLKKNNIKIVKQLWHGSRNENWMSIIVNSLKLNPDAIITGKMYGNGVYFAPSSMKSWNYTSFRGTSWASGNADIAFMGLYAVAYGTPYDTSTWNQGVDWKGLVKKNNADCLHAHAGAALKNDEIVFYDEAAMVLNYIVEFK